MDPNNPATSDNGQSQAPVSFDNGIDMEAINAAVEVANSNPDQLDNIEKPADDSGAVVPAAPVSIEDIANGASPDEIPALEEKPKPVETPAPEAEAVPVDSDMSAYDTDKSADEQTKKEEPEITVEEKKPAGTIDPEKLRKSTEATLNKIKPKSSTGVVVYVVIGVVAILGIIFAVAFLN